MSFMSSKKDRLNKSNFFIRVGLILLGLGFLIFILTFYQTIYFELRYLFTSRQKTTKQTVKPVPIKPVDTNFGIVIPKIGANSKVVANVNPFNEREYQIALTKGVAQAKGTSFPGQSGNIFIFSHSSANWYEANRYNSIFYLLHYLKKGDEIDLYYKNLKFKYVVSETKLVNPTAVNYLTGSGKGKTLTLMTCWPPGTSFERLLVIANQVHL